MNNKLSNRELIELNIAYYISYIVKQLFVQPLVISGHMFALLG